MKCDRCKTTIEPGEEQKHFGQVLCEDCYFDALSPLKTCDPWAVHSARNFEKFSGGDHPLTPVQKNILQILETKGPIEPSELLKNMGNHIQLDELQREFSSLRHMEKARGEKQGDKVLWRLW